jgi:hypothetical protein
MDEGIVEGSEDMCNAKYEFTFSNLWPETDDFFFLDNLLLGRLDTDVNIQRQKQGGWGSGSGTIMGILR